MKDRNIPPRGGRWKRSSGVLAGLFMPLLCACFWAGGSAYKPVIIVHGLFDSPKNLLNLQRFISESHPGTNVTIIDLFDGYESLKPLWTQVEGFKAVIYPIMQNAADGVHFICYSQGGLVCRGILSTLPEHNVHTFISLSSPQAGQYGDTDYFKDVFPECVKSEIYHFCYLGIGQRFSICNYWKDPHHKDLYVNVSSYLALLNTEKPHPNATEWRKNFLKIQKLVLIGGPDDGVITPWQSSQFGFYDDNETVVEMQKQDFYLSDAFGLKTLAAREDLITCTFPGVQHIQWHSNETVFHACMEKWLV
ncbi:lysosomal thioesterase PPT2 [Oryzias latipes]|uniref:palmitoyl-CoA hydrolase n=1 Tax=Oryzias latipes TaxID=8090 RepID=A0A3B3HAS9_ORYLA|nr:lysosomal thioesterase PPT2 [Oryzias latipes]